MTLTAWTWSAVRQQLIFEKYAGRRPAQACSRHGAESASTAVFSSTLTIRFIPLFLPHWDSNRCLPKPRPKGIDQSNAAFCYPAEIAHGFFHPSWSRHTPDYIFLPHFKAVPSLMEGVFSQVCPLVQGETFYLQATFRKPLDNLKSNGLSV